MSDEDQKTAKFCEQTLLEATGSFETKSKMVVAKTENKNNNTNKDKKVLSSQDFQRFFTSDWKSDQKDLMRKALTGEVKQPKQLLEKSKVTLAPRPKDLESNVVMDEEDFCVLPISCLICLLLIGIFAFCGF